MKIPKIVNAVGHIDEELIVGAMEEKTRRKPLRKWTAIAACLGVLVTVGLLMLPDTPQKEAPSALQSGRYKDVLIQSGESAILWPWESMTVEEKYTSVTVDGTEYRGRRRELPASFVGEGLGSFQTVGYDPITDDVYYETFDAYTIRGVSKQTLIALKMEDRYYVFLTEQYDPPKTWGQVMEGHSLSEYVKLRNFSFEGKGIEDNYHVLEDDAYIWDILGQCADAPAVDPVGWHETKRRFVSFTVSSEALGVYKHAMYVTEDGYLWTNALDWECLYDIGADAAGKIIDYAKDHSVETECEPYRNTVSGTVTQITDGYLLVDDSVLCRDPAEGITYRISLDNLRISRYVEHDIIKVGDLVQVSYEGHICEDNAISISKAILADGEVLIPE